MSKHYRRATPGERLAAGVLDAILVFSVVVTEVYIAYLLTRPYYFYRDTPGAVRVGTLALHFSPIVVLLVVAVAEAVRGTTLGKLAVGLRVRGRHPANRAILKYSLLVLPWLAVVGSSVHAPIRLHVLLTLVVWIAAVCFIPAVLLMAGIQPPYDKLARCGVFTTRREPRGFAITPSDHPL